MAAFAGRLHSGKRVNVRGYLRCRLGVWQEIPAHTRGWPRAKRGKLQT